MADHRRHRTLDTVHLPGAWGQARAVCPFVAASTAVAASPAAVQRAAAYRGTGTADRAYRRQGQAACLLTASTISAACSYWAQT